MKGGGKSRRERERAPAKRNGDLASARTGARSADGSTSDHPTVAMARHLAAIVETHSLSELIVDTPDLTLTLRRGWAGASAGGQLVAAAPVAPIALPAVPPPHPRASEAHGAGPGPASPPAAPEPHYHVVTSPFVGTFYSSPSPDADAYVVEGQRVDKGEVLCIVEAMKLMNEIEADMAGVVVSILVENAQPVEYGQPLFRLAPS